MSSIRMQQVRLFSESVENSCGRLVGASSSDIAESEIESSSTTGAVKQECYVLIMIIIKSLHIELRRGATPCGK